MMTYSVYSQAHNYHSYYSYVGLPAKLTDVAAGSGLSGVQHRVTHTWGPALLYRIDTIKLLLLAVRKTSGQ